MDQVRVALAWLKKNHFWVLSVLIALISMGCWWTASGKLAAQFATKETEIKGGFSQLDSIDAFHANETTISKQTAEKDEQAKNVAAIWKQLYERQQANVLVWRSPPLSKGFVDYINKHKFGDDIPPDLLENYQNYARRHFPELPKMVHAPLMLSNTGTSFSRGSGAEGGPISSVPAGGVAMPDDDNDYICQWLDQDFINEEMQFKQEPTPLRIWITQEDVWVYETLLTIIAKTNEAAGASRMSNAAVRVIQSLEVGKRAAPYSRTPGRVYLPVASAAAVPMEGGEQPTTSPEGPAQAAPPSSMSMGPESSGGATTPEQENANLVNYRYLDPQGQPMPFGGAPAAAEGEAPPPPAAVDPAAFGKEYKRLPVRMVLEMDQRWLQFLLAECANQPLQVEVKEVRFNPSDVGVGSEGGNVRNYSESGGTGGIPMPNRDGLQSFPAQPNMMKVVIQGVIYIFNKPDASVETTDQAQMAATTTQ